MSSKNGLLYLVIGFILSLIVTAGLRYINIFLDYKQVAMLTVVITFLIFIKTRRANWTVVLLVGLIIVLSLGVLGLFVIKEPIALSIATPPKDVDWSQVKGFVQPDVEWTKVKNVSLPNTTTTVYSYGGGGGGGGISSLFPGTGIVLDPNPIVGGQLPSSISFNESWGDARYLGGIEITTENGIVSSPNPIVDIGTLSFDTTWGDARYLLNQSYENPYFINSLNWPKLTWFPDPCPAGQAITYLGTIPTCTAFLQSYTETDPKFLAENSSIYAAIALRLNATDQRYNDTVLIGTKLDATDQRYNDTVLIGTKLDASDQRYNETILIASKLDATDQKYNDTAWVLLQEFVTDADSRLSDARTPVAHNQDWSTILNYVQPLVNWSKVVNQSLSIAWTGLLGWGNITGFVQPSVNWSSIANYSLNVSWAGKLPVSYLVNGSDGQVLKMSGTTIGWGTDLTGSGGGAMVTTTTCSGTNKVSAIDNTTGIVTCSADVDTNTWNTTADMRNAINNSGYYNISVNASGILNPPWITVDTNTWNTTADMRNAVNNSGYYNISVNWSNILNIAITSINLVSGIFSTITGIGVQTQNLNMGTYSLINATNVNGTALYQGNSQVVDTIIGKNITVSKAGGNYTLTLPFPTTVNIGGVTSKTCSVGDFVSTIGTDGVPLCTTPTSSGGVNMWINSSLNVLVPNASFSININTSGYVNATRFNGKIACTNIDGGSDGDYCTDATGVGGSSPSQWLNSSTLVYLNSSYPQTLNVTTLNATIINQNGSRVISDIVAGTPITVTGSATNKTIDITLPSCTGSQVLTVTDGNTFTCTTPAGGSSAPWEGVLHTNIGDGNPTSTLVLMHNTVETVAGPTPTGIGATVGRLQNFKYKTAITINNMSYHGVGAVSGIYTAAIYNSSGARQWTAVINTTAAAWTTIRIFPAVTIPANTQMWFGLGAVTIGTTAGFRTPVSPIASSLGLTTTPARLQENSIIYRQVALTAGAWPATLPSLSAAAFASAGTTGTIPIVFFQSN